ncbi:TetR/AcrR family transcriptional regulator C-terminal domain-containing protein [Marinobacterium mangrovicola]|uniref:TetR family transcriptional regulator n=1 Tax=Marinobacterium mangrovicola TaxID=1476959 RepID=A0A4R1GGL0_9GAMM|nr:TetR/AcrR family transcriptional regulator C-terminal domain-containing protein [Marinobacterium mangrovicola]TCK06083.1 TetR family transcriptional regulator [Marinobacterium mangrovicola]
MEQSAKPDHKRQAILTAAADVFLQHGFSGATTDMIQRAAGVSKATIYTRYPTKEALFCDAIEHLCLVMREQFAELAVDEEDLRTRLEAIAHAYMDLALSASAMALLRIVISEAPHFPSLARRFFLVGPNVIDPMVSRHLELAAEKGELDLHAVGTADAGRIFIGMLRGISNLEALTHPTALPSQAQIDRWVALAVDTFLRAYATEQP